MSRALPPGKMPQCKSRSKSGAVPPPGGVSKRIRSGGDRSEAWDGRDLPGCSRQASIPGTGSLMWRSKTDPPAGFSIDCRETSFQRGNVGRITWSHLTSLLVLPALVACASHRSGHGSTRPVRLQLRGRRLLETAGAAQHRQAALRGQPDVLGRGLDRQRLHLPGHRVGGLRTKLPIWRRRKLDQTRVGCNDKMPSTPRSKDPALRGCDREGARRPRPCGRRPSLTL